MNWKQPSASGRAGGGGGGDGFRGRAGRRETDARGGGEHWPSLAPPREGATRAGRAQAIVTNLHVYIDSEEQRSQSLGEQSQAYTVLALLFGSVSQSSADILNPLSPILFPDQSQWPAPLLTRQAIARGGTQT